MYHYLSTKDGKKIVDVEPWIHGGHFDFIGGVCNMKYMLGFYDTLTDEMKLEFRTDFDVIDEMRAWFFESFLPLQLKCVVNDENLQKTHHAIKKYLVKIGEKYGLVYGSD